MAPVSIRAASALAAAITALALACAGPSAERGAPTGLDERAAREVLARCAEAIRDGRAADALPLLSARWRASYTPERLATDLAGAGPAARESAARVVAELRAGAALELDARTARLPVRAGRAAVLVAEGGAWKVDALE
jgi:hypothetical protein